MTTTNELPKHVQRALNTIAHARALLHEVSQRDRLRREIDDLLSRGMSHADALEHLRANPPIVDPNY
ncbi:hypothetical protein M8R19_17940 [Pseudomonas sp. R3.Fl]|jgi:hypothetical protein|uniref:hypothetical protein n=1 Tax=Pseudomonas sp. R3.Fl TaxID=2928708 RepID=UPI00201DBAB7|nr:hypothetical protein [Pseudomonas sp. R3.Fl]MCL6690593.1 hypothetical protein [Pseudomonas sp. R3.Fl]